ncbi:MAG: metallophosphoesterase [Flavobacteriaceae bacterium]|nr:metallophosphoesterase [Flavobacteriaceae bacterium]
MSTRNISLNKYITILVFILMDVYVYFALRKSINKSKYQNIYKYLYFFSVFLSYIGLYFLYTNFTEKPLEASVIPNLFIGFFFSFFVFKLLFIVFILFEDVIRFIELLFSALRKLFSSKPKKIITPGRRKFIRQSGLIVAGIPFISMIYGVVKGRYDFKVHNIKLAFKNLPKSFDGFKIVQISDIHIGSFDSREAINRGIDLVNEQNADIILFTGDLVNNDSRELIPFIENFKRLRAKHGVYSVLGNHDYGDYKKWNSEKEKKENMDLLFDYQKQMNFQLLNNENVTISKNGESIGILGVENWGNSPFPRRGDIDEALKGVENLPFKILMSHDPTHFTKRVVPHKTHFDLTLAGHTHGMQFGIDIPGFKWSPIEYIYPQWAGLYEEGKQYLYVNRGFGFLGFPGRAGIRPEITVIEVNHVA